MMTDGTFTAKSNLPNYVGTLLGAMDGDKTSIFWSKPEGPNFCRWTTSLSSVVCSSNVCWVLPRFDPWACRARTLHLWE
jgi:hypothetical protein